MAKYSFETADLVQSYLNLPEEEYIVAIVHDIRHCCTSISGFGEVIRMATESGEAGTLGFVNNYVTMVPKQLSNMANVLDAAIEFDRTQKGDQNGVPVNPEVLIDEATILGLWDSEPEQFIPSLVNYVRMRGTGIQLVIERLQADMLADSSAVPPAIDTYITDILTKAADIVNVTRAAVEYDQAQRNKQSNS